MIWLGFLGLQPFNRFERRLLFYFKTWVNGHTFESSTISVGYHGHVWCAKGGGTFVYLLRPQGESYAHAFSFYTFYNVYYVSWCIGYVGPLSSCWSTWALTLMLLLSSLHCQDSCTPTWRQRRHVLYTTTHSWHGQGRRSRHRRYRGCGTQVDATR